MEALDEMDLAARLSLEAKEYWVHLNAEGPFEKYPAKQHARRVQEKLGIDEGLIYLTGQPARNNEDSDMPAPFRQKRYFYYLTGCNEPSCHMIYDIQHDTLSLFIQRIDPRRVIWNGRGSTLAEAIEKYDIDQVYYVDELGDVIKDWSSYYGGHGSDIYVLHNGQLPQIPGLHAIVDSESLQPAMNAARMIKDEHEVGLIRKANKISSDAHEKVLANILNFKNEAQVEGLFMDICISHQAKQQAYDPIAASGPNAGTLHYDANNEDFRDRQLMCLDAGCEYELYASDITRTFPLAESWPTKEAEDIYKLVELMQESCIARLAPGIRYLDLHILAHQIAIDGLLKLGILHNGTKEEIYAAGTSKAFFPHGLGHHVGLEVHDVGQAELMSVWRGRAVLQQCPSIFPQDFHLPVFDPALCHAPTDAQSSHLEEGMVVTVEPGIYFSPYALQHFYLPSPVHSRFINETVLHRYMGVGGVRIEDDILITSRGYENLTTAPKGNAMFDIIRGHPSVTRDAQSPRAILPRSEIEPPLLRAPGCPLRTTASGPQPRPPQHAAIISSYLHQNHTATRDCRNKALNFRRSMTTDERVQHWRQQCQQPLPERSKVSQKHQQTMCGATTASVKHISIGDSQSHPLQASGLAACTDCAILAQTLCRLRQNLALSNRSPANDVQQPPSTPNTTGRSHSSPHMLVTAEPMKSEAKPDIRTRPTGTTQGHDGTYQLSSAPEPRSLRSAQSKMSSNNGVLLLETQPTKPRNNVLFKDTVSARHHHIQSSDPEEYYRGHELCAPAPTATREPKQQILQAGNERSTDVSRYPTLKSQSSMPLSKRMSQQQDQRRPSNHTDDRDWMA